MAKFVFRLQSYLKVKEKMEEQKKLEYGKAVQKLENEKEKKKRFETEEGECFGELRGVMESGLSANEFIRRKQYLVHLERKITNQDEQVKKAANYTESKRVELIGAMKEKKMLETLKEHKYEEYRVEENKAEQKTIDEIVSYRYGNSED